MRPLSLLPIKPSRGTKTTGAPSPTGSPLQSPCRCPHPCHCVGNILPCAHSHCAQDRSTGGVHPSTRTRSGTLRRGEQVVGLPSLVWGFLSSHGVFKERGEEAQGGAQAHTHGVVCLVGGDRGLITPPLPSLNTLSIAGVSGRRRLPSTLPSQVCSAPSIGRSHMSEAAEGVPSPSLGLRHQRLLPSCQDLDTSQGLAKAEVDKLRAEI